MKFVRITHYLKLSNDAVPAFIVLMSNGCEYISVRDKWFKDTPKDRMIFRKQQNQYPDLHYVGIEEAGITLDAWLNMLSEAPAIEIEDLVDGRWMFCGSRTSSWEHPLPNLKDGAHMFEYSGISEWSVNLPKLEVGRYMFTDSKIIRWDADLPRLKDGVGMFNGSRLSSWNGATPELANGIFMFLRTTIRESDLITPKLGETLHMFDPVSDKIC